MGPEHVRVTAYAIALSGIDDSCSPQQWSGPSLLEELFDGPGTAMSNIEDNYPPFPFHEAKPTPLLSVPQININTSLASPYMSGLLPSQSPMQNTPGRISPSAPGYTPSPSHSFHSPPTPAGPMYSPYPQSSLQSSPMTAHPTMVPSSAWSTPEVCRRAHLCRCDSQCCAAPTGPRLL